MAEVIGQDGSDERLDEDWELVKSLLQEQWEPFGAA
jgi:hypothetical protein